MCLNPQFVPNRGLNKGNYASEHGNLVDVPSNLHSKKRLLQVPCGKCAECRATYFNSIKQRAIVESMSSYILFVTLTIDNKHINNIVIDGENYKYIDYTHVKNMFKRLRADKEFIKSIDYRDYRYLVVMEYGDKTHRPHFHFLIFVAKKPNDSFNKRYDIEAAFKANLGEYWAINVGTRKHPIYEKLYKENKPYIGKDGKMRTNYYVKLVQGDIENTIFGKQTNDDLTYIKTIQYLLGYINKPNSYSWKIHKLLERYKEKDYELYKEYRNKLLGDIKFSKGFGCGYTDSGKKYYMEKISVRCSSNTYLYTEFTDNLPDTYEEFADSYPDMAVELQDWIEEDIYTRYKSWNEFTNKISADDYFLHMAYVTYFRKEFTARFKSYFNKVKNGSIGYLYSVNRDNYLYQPQKVRTTEADKDSKIYKFLRKGVEDGLRLKVPYLAFQMTAQQKFVPLCKYYKDRVCTLDDTLALYEKLGVKNFDEYTELFNKEISNYRSLEQVSNIVKHYNDDVIQGDINNIYTIKDDEVYSKLIWNNK